jgi:hypothetical protein
MAKDYLGLTPEFGRYKITGRLAVADRYFSLEPDGETWGDAALANTTIADVPRYTVAINSPLSVSGSIMMRAEVDLNTPNRVFMSKGTINIVVKASLDVVDAKVESRISLKIRKLMDAHECPFFVLPFSVVTKKYKKLADIQPAKGQGRVEKYILSQIIKRINVNKAKIAEALAKNTVQPIQEYQFPMAIKYFVMEDVNESETLFNWLSPAHLIHRAKDARDIRVMMKEVIAIFLQIMEALKTMAKHGITHNDLHWSNIFVQRCDHSFVVDGVHIESKYIAKVFDWDRSVCDDTKCRNLRTKESLSAAHRAHVHAYTPGYDLVGFFKSFEDHMTRCAWEPKYDHLYVEAEYKNFYKAPMAWLMSEMLNPMAELFNTTPSLRDPHVHPSNPCLTNMRDSVSGTSIASHKNGWNALVVHTDNTYPKNCLHVWSDDVEVPDPEEVTATLLKCLLWAQADPETPEFMIQGRRDFYNGNILNGPRSRSLLDRLVPTGVLLSSTRRENNIDLTTYTQQARWDDDDLSPVVSVRVTNFQERNGMALMVLQLIRSHMLDQNGRQFFVFPFEFWNNSAVDFNIGHNAIETAMGLKRTDYLEYTIEEDMRSSGTRTLRDWIKPNQRWKSLNSMDFFEALNGLMDSWNAVVLQVLLAIQSLESLNVKHNGLSSLNNIYVQECEHSFWVDRTLITTGYLVKIGGWSGATTTTAEDIATSHRDLRDFVSALHNENMGSFIHEKESQLSYVSQMMELRGVLARDVDKSIKAKNNDVCSPAIEWSLHQMSVDARCSTTPRGYFDELTMGIGTSKSPREQWCRVLELWMQMMYGKCDFNNDSYRVHRLAHASTCRIYVDGVERTVPAHARVEETPLNGDNGNYSLIDNILQLLPKIQIAADERLVTGIQPIVRDTQNTEQARYNDQNKIKYVIVLMTECHTSLGYDREGCRYEALMKTLYQHWVVASARVHIMKPEHRVLARANMGTSRRVLEPAGGSTGGVSAKRANDIAHESARTKAGFANAQYMADQTVRAEEAILDTAVKAAHSARLAAYNAGAVEIGLVHAVLSAEKAAKMAQAKLAKTRTYEVRVIESTSELNLESYVVKHPKKKTRRKKIANNE